MTTGHEFPGYPSTEVIAIVASETAIGVNLLRDIANSWRDLVGGRSTSTQNALKEARSICLQGLSDDARSVNADAVVGLRLDYTEVSANGSGGGILVVAAVGTAVKLHQTVAPSDHAT